MSESSEFKFPCAVNIVHLEEFGVIALTEAFVKLGAHNRENNDTNSIGSWHYYGVDSDNTTRFWDYLEDYCYETDPAEVTVYTYEQIMDLSKTSSEALQDTLEEKATEVLAKEESGLESNTGASTGFEVNPQGGMKETLGKLRWTLLPLVSLKEVVKVLEYGATKYSADNWQKVDKEKYKEALWRHWVAYNQGEVYDPETGLHHVAHLLCDGLFILWFDLTGKKDE